MCRGAALKGSRCADPKGTFSSPFLSKSFAEAAATWPSTAGLIPAGPLLAWLSSAEMQLGENNVCGPDATAEVTRKGWWGGGAWRQAPTGRGNWRSKKKRRQMPSRAAPAKRGDFFIGASFSNTEEYWLAVPQPQALRGKIKQHNGLSCSAVAATQDKCLEKSMSTEKGKRGTER